MPSLFAMTVLSMFLTRVKISPYANPFIELATILIANSPINLHQQPTSVSTFFQSYSRETSK